MFIKLEKGVRGSGLRARSTNPTIGVMRATSGKPQTLIAIPRELMRHCEMSDLPGDKFDIMVGTGPDAGIIAIVPGTTYTAGRQGRNMIAIRTTRLSETVRSSERCEYLADRKRLLIHLPAGFPLVEQPSPVNGATAPRTTHTETMAAAHA